MTRIGNQREMEEALGSYSTPFNVQMTGEQNLQFSIDPTEGLTKRRYQWYSNDSLFDSTHFSSVESGIRIDISGANDEARVSSSILGLYVAQTLARPGIGMVVDDANTSVDSETNEASLSHGEIYAGAFWWDEANDEVETGIGYKWDGTGWYFFVKSLGDHLGDSPVPQSDFGIDAFDGSGLSGQVADPAVGYVYNWPYTWYNQGPIEGALLNPVTNRLEETTRLAVSNRPSFDTPNLPVQLVVRNAGTAQSLGVELGGLQYSTYGGGVDDIEFRETDETRITEGQSFVSDTKVLTNDAIDPSAQPGNPLVSFRREADAKSIAVAVQEISARPISDDIYIYQWDEWNPDTALTGATFNDPTTIADPTESRIVTDTQATDYTPSSDAILRSVRFFEGGAKNQTGETVTQRSDTRLGIGATRVVTAVNDGDSNADVDPFFIKIEESI